MYKNVEKEKRKNRGSNIVKKKKKLLLENSFGMAPNSPFDKCRRSLSSPTKRGL
jgi:hypothetical protein